MNARINPITASSATLAVLGNWKLSVYMMSPPRATTPPQIQASQDATTMARGGGGDDGGWCTVPVVLAPNGSSLSCGRNGRWRKAVERQIKRLASETTQFFPTGERPAASSAC